MKKPSILRILFLSEKNAARSLMAEALLNTLGANRFEGFSAGATPATTPNPLALAEISTYGYLIELLQCKSWQDFARQNADAPPMDAIITLCDTVNGQAQPDFPGRPALAFWGLTDPEKFTHNEASPSAAFARTLQILRFRIQALCDLPPTRRTHATLEDELELIGTLTPPH
jgi:arsenate reductase (thioredoxin)